MKKKGSSLVFSVLMLAFFLALSLNIYFLARKKAERAGVKVAGEVSTNHIDMASSLGYQELLLAENFVREGFPYDNSHPASNETYTLADRNEFYLDLSTGFYTNRFSGVQLNNFIDYFSSVWDYTLDSDGNSNATGTNNQKLIIGEEIVSGKVNSRIWQSAGIPDKRIYLWNVSGGTSIGGYSFVSMITDPDVASGETFLATYEKFIRLPDVTIGSDTIVQEAVFRITVRERFDSTDSGVTISNRNIVDFIIEAI